MKSIILILVLLLSCCTLLDTTFQSDNRILLSTVSPTNSNIVLVYISDAAQLSTNKMSTNHFHVSTSSNIFIPDSFQILRDENCILLNFTESLDSYPSLLLVFPNTNTSISYLSTSNGYSVDIVPQAVFINSLESEYAITNSTIGPALIPGTGTTFAAGKWNDGVDCGSGVSQSSAVTIPGGTIPMSDFTIAFWYTRTSDFTNGQLAYLLFSAHNSLSHTNNLTVHLITPWDLSNKPGGGILYALTFGIRISDLNQKQVYCTHDFGSIAALHNAFPLNTPVHIAVTKRNSDGRMRIFLNGIQLPTQYINCYEPFFTDDLSQIANKSGYFPFETYLGNTHALRGNYPAKGIINNMVIYPCERESINLLKIP